MPPTATRARPAAWRNHFGDDRGALGEIVNRSAPLGHQPLLGLGKDRVIFRMQHTQDTRRAGRLESLVPIQHVGVVGFPGKEVLPVLTKPRLANAFNRSGVNGAGSLPIVM